MENLDKINKILEKGEDYDDLIGEDKQIADSFKKFISDKNNKEELKKLFFEAIDKNYYLVIECLDIENFFSEKEIIDFLKTDIKNQEVKEKIKDKILDIISAYPSVCSMGFFKALFTETNFIPEGVYITKLLSNFITYYFLLNRDASKTFFEEKQNDFNEKIKFLIERKNIDLTCEENAFGEILLQDVITIRPQNLELIKIILKETTDLSIISYSNFTIIDSLFCLEDTEIKEQITNLVIEKVLELNQINDLLCKSIKNGETFIIKFLFNSLKKSLNKKKFDCFEAFSLAIKLKDQETIDFLKKEYNETFKYFISDSEKISQFLETEEIIKDFIENKENNFDIALDLATNNISNLNLNIIETTLLHEIVKMNNISYVDKFFSKIAPGTEIDLNIKDSNDMTPFFIAIENGNIKLFLRLLQKQKNFKQYMHENINDLLYYACKSKNNKILNFLLKTGKNIDLLHKYKNGQTLLHMICNNSFIFDNNINENSEIIESFLDNILDANILNEKDSNGFTPLHLAIKNNNTYIILYLLKRKEIDLNIKGPDGSNLLNLAIMNNNFFAFKNLFNIYHCTNNEINVDELFYNSCKTKNSWILKFLVSKQKPNLLHKYENDQNLLHIICSNKNMEGPFNISFELIKSLLSNSNINILDINIPDKNGDTPLDLALQNNNFFTASFIVRHMDLKEQDIRNLKIIKEENKKLLLNNICISQNNENFLLLYNKEYLGDSFEDPIFYFNLLNNAYSKKNYKIISKLEENLDIQIKNLLEKISENNINYILINLIYNINPNFKLFNKIIEIIENSKNDNLKNINIYKIYKDLDTFKNIQNNNQIKIDREFIKYNKTEKAILVVDTAYGRIIENGKLNEKEILYEAIKYINNCTLVNFYKKGTIEKNEENKLISMTIYNNGIIRFNFDKNKNYENLEKEINEIVNNNYLDISGFDNILSCLVYAPIQLKEDKENTIIKNNCNLETLIDSVKESLDNETKTYICDFAIDQHNVQTVIYKGKLYIINTGYSFDYLHEEIKNKFNAKYKGSEIKITELNNFGQSTGNCVIASKLYLKSLIVQNKANYKKLIKDIKRWQDISDIQEKKDANLYNPDFNQEEGLLKEILDLNNLLFENNKKHFDEFKLRFNKLKEYFFYKKLMEIFQNSPVHPKNVK